MWILPSQSDLIYIGKCANGRFVLLLIVEALENLDLKNKRPTQIQIDTVAEMTYQIYQNCCDQGF